MDKRPTLSDVARSCGVSAATVSRVLNHKRDNNFSTTEEVRQKILIATQDLGYRPDPNARSLSTGNTNVVGLFASPRTHVAEGINEPLIEGIVETLHSGGYEVFFEMTPIHKTRERLPPWRFDGAVLMQDPKPDTVIELDTRGVPYVCVNERVGQATAYVLADDVMGMNRAIDHLVQLGHRRFAYANARIAEPRHYSVMDRYNTLLAAAGGSLELVSGHETPCHCASEFLLKTVVKQSATAVIAYDHKRAITLLAPRRKWACAFPSTSASSASTTSFPWPRSIPPCQSSRSLAGRWAGWLRTCC